MTIYNKLHASTEALKLKLAKYEQFTEQFNVVGNDFSSVAHLYIDNLTSDTFVPEEFGISREDVAVELISSALGYSDFSFPVTVSSENFDISYIHTPYFSILFDENLVEVSRKAVRNVIGYHKYEDSLDNEEIEKYNQYSNFLESISEIKKIEQSFKDIGYSTDLGELEEMFTTTFTTNEYTLDEILDELTLALREDGLKGMISTDNSVMLSHSSLIFTEFIEEVPHQEDITLVEMKYLGLDFINELLENKNFYNWYYKYIAK